MNRKAALEIIKSGKFFTAKFTKKNGEQRTLNGRYGVKKHLKGGVMPYKPGDYGLVVVHENESPGKAGGYKSLPINEIFELNGKPVK